MSTNKTSVSSGSSILPIGIRNNNPLNIRKSANNWQGKVLSDNAFEKFSNIKYGIRAAVKNLQTYYTRDKLQSVSKIINKWAPPIENNTDNYVKYVSGRLSISPTAKLPYTAESFSILVAAMSEIEVGKKYGVSDSQVDDVIKEFKLF